jgi:hypothetical protein
MSSACTLLLTQGTQIVISEESAEDVESAMENRSPTVDIMLDMTGGGDTFSRARVAMAHVIAVIRHPEPLVAPLTPDQPNVYALRRR